MKDTKSFPIECIADDYIFVRVKRFDGLFYNPNSQTFEDDPALSFDLVPGEGVDENIWVAKPSVEITEEFPPGRYTIYYYKPEGLFGAVYETLPNEKSPDEIANRLANIQIGEATLRFALIKMSRQLDEILSILKPT